MENYTVSVQPRRARIVSVDILRGLVMVIMAVDHVRDAFAPTPVSPEDMDPLQPAWFFSRWITHFCAPVFILLSGTAAFLHGEKVGNRAALSRFLWTRGLWLILVELVWMNLGLTLHLSHQNGFLFVQVIWAIGWSMIVLAGLVWLPRWAIAVFSLVLIAGHNLLDAVTPEFFGAFSWLWKFLHMGFSFIDIWNGAFGILVVYPLIPWIAVMSAGYLLGSVLLWEPARRRSVLLRWSLGLTLLFVVLRYLALYGDPNPWTPQATFTDSLMAFLNTEKYPPSLMYLLMTIGPSLILLALLEKAQGFLANVLLTFGKVPFFYYVVHFPLIVLLSFFWYYLQYGRYLNFVMTPPDEWPEGFEPHLGLAWVVWFLFMIPMYYLCRWYGKYKATHDYWWLKYL